MMNTTKLLKTIVNTIANIGIFSLTIQILATIIAALFHLVPSDFLPAGGTVIFSSDQTFIGSAIFAVLLTLANTMMIVGLHHFKKFVRGFAKEDLFEVSTITFLKKSSLVLAAYAIIESLMFATPNHFQLNLKMAATFFIASLVLTFIKKEVKETV